MSKASYGSLFLQWHEKHTSYMTKAAMWFLIVPQNISLDKVNYSCIDRYYCFLLTEIYVGDSEPKMRKIRSMWNSTVLTEQQLLYGGIREGLEVWNMHHRFTM